MALWLTSNGTFSYRLQKEQVKRNTAEVLGSMRSALLPGRKEAIATKE
jgi:hypothetical protein